MHFVVVLFKFLAGYLLVRVANWRDHLLVLLRVVSFDLGLLLLHPVLVVGLLVLALHCHAVDLAGGTAAFERLDCLSSLYKRALHALVGAIVGFFFSFVLGVDGLASSLLLMQPVQHALVLVVLQLRYEVLLVDVFLLDNHIVLGI